LTRRPLPFWEFGLGISTATNERKFEVSDIAPGDELELTQVEIHSPGIWEFLGQVNPLQQIREYLNDRHERRKDSEYREFSEKEKLELENQLLRKQLQREDLQILQDELGMLRELGFDENDLRQLVWQRIGQPLARLGKHQDNGLIGRSGNKNAVFKVDPKL
jgi:hypothetical protein